jgi:cytochrome c556
MFRTLLVCVALGAAIGSASSQEDPIAKRRQIYKSFGQAAKEPGAMLKKEQPFELATVQAALRTFQDGSRKLPDLFPENSKTGGETAALPIIWEDKAKFNALFVKFNQDTTTALATITDEATFRSEFPKVLRDCGGCHDTFRLKK